MLVKQQVDFISWRADLEWPNCFLACSLFSRSFEFSRRVSWNPPTIVRHLRPERENIIRIYDNEFRFSYWYCFWANILYSLSNKVLDVFSQLQTAYLSPKLKRFSASSLLWPQMIKSFRSVKYILITSTCFPFNG